MSKLYITHELAIALKETSFDEPCIVCYEQDEIEGFFELRNFVNSSGIISGLNSKRSAKDSCCAPTYSQVIDWFIEKHNLEINVKSWKGEGDGIIVWIYSVKQLGVPSTYRFDTKSFSRIEAWQKAINVALKMIK